MDLNPTFKVFGTNLPKCFGPFQLSPVQPTTVHLHGRQDVCLWCTSISLPVDRIPLRFVMHAISSLDMINGL